MKAKSKAGGAAPQGAPPVAQPTAAVGQPSVATNGSQPDYSAQWAEYYRSLGKHKEAEAIEAQMKSKVHQYIQLSPSCLHEFRLCCINACLVKILYHETISGIIFINYKFILEFWRCASCKYSSAFYAG